MALLDLTPSLPYISPRLTSPPSPQPSRGLRTVVCVWRCWPRSSAGWSSWQCPSPSSSAACRRGMGARGGGAGRGPAGRGPAGRGSTAGGRHTHMRRQTHTHTHTHTCTRALVCMYTHTHADTHMRRRVDVHMHTPTQVHTNKLTHTHTHSHSQLDVHAYAQTHTGALASDSGPGPCGPHIPLNPLLGPGQSTGRGSRGPLGHQTNTGPVSGRRREKRTGSRRGECWLEREEGEWDSFAPPKIFHLSQRADPRLAPDSALYLTGGLTGYENRGYHRYHTTGPSVGFIVLLFFISN